MYVTLGLWGASLETHSSLPQQTLTKLPNVTIWPQKQWNWSLPMKLNTEIWSSHCRLLHNSLSLLRTVLSWAWGGTPCLPALPLPRIPDTLKTPYLSEAQPKGVKSHDHPLQEHSTKRSVISKTQITQQVLWLPAMSSTQWERARAIAEWRI